MTRLSRFRSTHKHTRSHTHTLTGQALEIPLMTACDRTWFHPPHRHRILVITALITLLGLSSTHIHSHQEKPHTCTHGAALFTLQMEIALLFIPPSLFILLADLCLVMSTPPFTPPPPLPSGLEAPASEERGKKKTHNLSVQIG